MTHPGAASTPQLALEDEQIERCFQVLSELRPHVPRDSFVDQVRAMQPFGYRLAFIQQGDTVVTVAGYRLALNFHLGRHLYVEDLVSAPGVRSQGYGAAMLEWLAEQALAAGCRFIDLDSGTQRHAAHRFYLAHGYSIQMFHFTRELESP